MPLISESDAIHLLQKEDIVAIPTETVYGLAARADSLVAVEKVYVAKQRPRDNPLICHFDSLAMIQKYVPNLPGAARMLILALAPGPISILVHLPENSPLLPATGGKQSVICRIPDHEVARRIISGVGVPLAAPSANTSGKVSPTTAEMVEHDIGGRIPGIVDGGPCTVGIESTIVDCRNKDRLVILRPGVIGVEDIQILLDAAHRDKPLLTPITCEEAETAGDTETTPGAKYKHYAPQTPVYPFSSEAIRTANIKKTVVIGTAEALIEANLPPNTQTISLSSRQNMPEVTRRFYHTLFTLDTMGPDAAYLIYSDWPKGALGRALTNRVKKILSSPLL